MSLQETRSPRGLNAQVAMPKTRVVRESAVSLRSSVPLRASQSLTVLSAPAETMVSLSGEKAQALTESVWPSRVARSAPLRASQSLRVVSSLPETMVSPSGEKAQAQTP